ncbi:hypothetical protein GCM10010317_000610 [Streptomyces mirabilis]|nr:hypothetical protein GCM10010317_000610 [Streptomyces mirabilis]
MVVALTLFVRVPRVFDRATALFCPLRMPRACRPLTLAVTGSASVTAEDDYLPAGPTKIYAGWSRHWEIAWLWFLS